MSRPKPSLATIQRWLTEFPGLVLTDGSELRCSLCNTNIAFTRKSDVVRHCSSEKHKSATTGESSAFEIQNNFNSELVRFMVGCNIPWTQLDNPVFKDFMDKCINGAFGRVKVPTESTIRKNYLPQAATTAKSTVYAEIEDKYLWVSVDETTNANGSKVTNVVVGEMSDMSATQSHLIASKILEDTNAKTVAKLVDDTLKELWGAKHDEKKNMALLFLTEAVPYMNAACRILKGTYNYDMLHVTCLAHGLHRVAETIRDRYLNVDRLISNGNKVFLKAPQRVALFAEMLPDTELPPAPVITQWGTWIEAASYYYRNFEDVTRVFRQLNPNDAIAIANTQKALENPAVLQDLAYIHGNFLRIPEAIEKLESKPKTNEFSIVDAMNVVWDLRHYIFQLEGDTADAVKRKLTEILDNNPGFSTIALIVNLSQKKEVDVADPQINMKALQHFPYFRYAPLTSVDVERSFSHYKWIFTDRRRSLTAEHLEQLLIIHSHCSLHK